MDPAIKNMTTEEKLALVEELWEDIEKEWTCQIPEATHAILGERWDQHLKNPASGISLDEFISKYSS